MRKTMIVLAVALMPVLAAAAELKVGTIQVSGGSMLGLGSGSVEVTTKVPGLPNEVDKVDVTRYTLDGGALYYLTPMVGIGLDLSYDSTKQELAPVTETDTTVFIGPKVGVDIGIAEKVSVFGDLSLGYAKAESKHENSANPAANRDLDGTGWGTRISAGIKYFPIPSLSLDAGLAYTYAKVSFSYLGADVDTKTTMFGVRGGISVYFGN